MQFTSQQLNDTWDALKEPGKAKKVAEAENALMPAPKIVVDDEVAQVISLPIKDGADRAVYGRRPGGSWVLIP